MSDPLKVLEESTRLKLDLLDELYYQNTWVTSEELSKKFKLPISKIHKLVMALQNDSKALFKDESRFLMVKGRGVFSQLKDILELENLHQNIIENTLTFKIMDSISMKNNLTIQQLVEENFVSESLIRKKIFEMNKFFYKLDQKNPVKIVSRKGTFRLHGEETSIQLLLEDIYWRLYHGRSWPFKTIQKEKVTYLITNLIEKSMEKMNPVFFVQLAYIIAIRLIRSNNGKNIQLREDLREYLPICEKLDTDGYCIKTLIQLGLTKEESLFLVLELFVRTQMFQRFNRSAPFYLEALNNTKAGKIADFIVRLHITLYGQLSNSEEAKLFQLIFITNLYVDLFGNLKYDSDGKFLYREYARYYPEMIGRTKSLLEQLYKKTNIDFLLDSPYLVSHYILVFSHFQNIVAHEEEVIVYLETDLPELIEQQLITQLESYFGNNFNLRIYSDVKKLSQEQKEYDLIISNGVVENLLRYSKNKPYFVLSNKLKVKDYQELHALFLECTQRKRNKKQKNKTLRSVYSFEYLLENDPNDFRRLHPK